MCKRGLAMGKKEAMKWIQDWYSKHCDGEWEIDRNVIVAHLEEHQWKVIIQIEDTECEGKEFDEVRVEKSETDWYHCSVKDQRFQGHGGVQNLTDIIEIFRVWVLEIRGEKFIGQRNA